ncbi:hypothetical protein Y032_0089g2296 [Ancylostoma ceylanicum]|uniref:Uncharacterized protein n=1 Tax=Ancylostoma ceylanicum TaxID=53326 RepID=A0A016TML7_9BILA|nr:hypothetical protein Y032_0089g2296 [Ancylostoma ceylanicum]
MRRTRISDQTPSGTEVKPDPDSSARTTDSGNPPSSSTALGTRAGAQTSDPSPTPDDGNASLHMSDPSLSMETPSPSLNSSSIHPSAFSGAPMESPTPPALHSLAIAMQDYTMASRATPATATSAAPTPATRTTV